MVIPCHKSEAEIGEVVRRVLMYIPPENIVICDNGNFPWPTDKTFEVVKAQHPSVRYGNKSSLGRAVNARLCWNICCTAQSSRGQWTWYSSQVARPQC